MSGPAKFRIVLGENDSMKLTLPSGIPRSFEELKNEIRKQCAVTGEFRLQYLDSDFDDFLNLTSTVDLEDKGTLKVVAQNAFEVCSPSSADTDILSSSASPSPTPSISASLSHVSSVSASDPMSSSSKLRCEAWPANFPIPTFPHEVELELQRAHEQFMNDGTSLNVESKPKVKSEILKSLAAEIIKYKA